MEARSQRLLQAPHVLRDITATDQLRQANYVAPHGEATRVPISNSGSSRTFLTRSALSCLIAIINSSANLAILRLHKIMSFLLLSISDGNVRACPGLGLGLLRIKGPVRNRAANPRHNNQQYKVGLQKKRGMANRLCVAQNTKHRKPNQREVSALIKN